MKARWENGALTILLRKDANFKKAIYTEDAYFDYVKFAITYVDADGTVNQEK